MYNYDEKMIGFCNPKKVDDFENSTNREEKKKYFSLQIWALDFK